jgi:hypothetical protein
MTIRICCLRNGLPWRGVHNELRRRRYVPLPLQADSILSLEDATAGIAVDGGIGLHDGRFAACVRGRTTGASALPTPLLVAPLETDEGATIPFSWYGYALYERCCQRFRILTLAFPLIRAILCAARCAPRGNRPPTR